MTLLQLLFFRRRKLNKPTAFVLKFYTVFILDMYLDKELPVDSDAAGVSSVRIAGVCLNPTVVKAGVVGHGHAIGAILFALLQQELKV